jgi:amidase/aspartyl-tRNA(Asn)/glutamyl-tRNA(Gln) amidotransferase subunit A
MLNAAVSVAEPINKLGAIMADQEDLAKTDSATVLAAKIRRKEVSPVEVVDAAIARIEAFNPKINALIIFGFDEARAAAKEAESAIMRGDEVGALHGVPIAMKDCFDFKPGWVTTFGGIRALKDYVVDTYCMFAERMEQAGAIIVGKTNSPVFGFRGTCDNYLFGPSKNPFDPTKNTGGSSGGSAGAVAAGLLPLCEGTDGGGSIRIPASWCGVYGFKPAFGRVPLVTRPDAFSGNIPFIFEGPITRTVEDSALAMTVLAGYDSRDPYAVEGNVDFMGALRASVADKKIAYTRDYGIFPVDPRVTAVVDKAVAAFEEAGAHVEEVDIGLRRAQSELSDVWCRSVAPKQVAAIEGFKREGIDLLRDHRDDLPPELLHWDEIGRRMTVTEHLADLAIRTEVLDALRVVLDSYDLLVSPTLACLAVDNANDGNTLGPPEINGEAIDRLIGWCMTYLINFIGYPAATVPAGFAENGLPVGMQIVGKRYADADVIAASAEFERQRPWIDSYQRCKL